ncbi:MAG: MFS transporter [Akkermansia sp.]|nr:MFS transporter [Akkermansia sp.]
MNTPAQQAVSRLWNVTYSKAWGANFLLFFSFMLMTPLFPLYLSETFGAGKDTIGLVLAGYSVMAILARFVSGYLVDSFPRVRVLVISYLLFALCTGGYLLAGNLVLFALVRTLHGAPFGAVTVANSTVAVDALPFSRRAEGIGYYGLSNNVATAIAPSIALFVYAYRADFNLLMWLSFALALAGCALTATTRLPRRPRPLPRKPFRLRGLILWSGRSPACCIICFSFAYGIVSTYIALYSVEILHLAHGAGAFFLLFSVGLILSRLIGSRTLRQGKILQNGTVGVVLGVIGYALMALVHAEWSFYPAALIMGLGNGHMFPAMQNIFMGICTREQRGTANSTLLISWDIGVAIGTSVGGIAADMLGFDAAFGIAAFGNLAGALFYIFHTRADYLRRRIG